eukprot:623252-Rhodomonas_salina.1
MFSTAYPPCVVPRIACAIAPCARSVPSALCPTGRCYGLGEPHAGSVLWCACRKMHGASTEHGVHRRIATPGRKVAGLTCFSLASLSSPSPGWPRHVLSQYPTSAPGAAAPNPAPPTPTPPNPMPHPHYAVSQYRAPVGRG